MNDMNTIITWAEILTRAKMNIMAEAFAVERAARESGLPMDCYNADRERLEAKRLAIDSLIQLTGVEI